MTKKATVTELAQGGIPSGVVWSFAGSTAPTGWIICDGSAISRTLYADLYAAIGTTYGTGDGSTTFNIPDGRGRSIVGVGTATGAYGATAHTLGQKAGEETHVLSIAEMPSHVHRQKVVANTGNPVDTRRDFESDINGTEYDQGVDTYPTGGGGAHNNMHPYIGMNHIIKI
jgi:microcystin-dependent protein